jgi:predicted nicotinamide N-methyase
VQQPPLVPELSLHLADDMMRMWERLSVEMDGDAPAIPFWGSAWVGGQALARYVLDHPEEVAGRSVLDLATGSGLCAIAALRSGARMVTAADVDPLSEAAVRLNAAVNEVQLEMLLSDLLVRPAPEVDVIMAGDVCYEEEMAGTMLPWLQAAYRRGVRVLLGDPGRHFFPREIMEELAAYDIPTTWEVEGAERKRTGVYTFSPAAMGHDASGGQTAR